MSETTEKATIKVENYGEMLAVINDLELVSFKTDGGYQGDYLAVCKDDKRLFYFIDSYGSCSGCDWLQDVGNADYYDENYRYVVPYKEAVNFCAGIKPSYIVPIERPLEFTSEEYGGFKLKTPSASTNN